MHLPSMYTIILFAGLAYGDIPPAIASIDSALSSLASINGIVSPNYSASPTVSSTAVSSGFQTGIPTNETHTGAPITTTPVMISSGVTLPVTTPVIGTSSSASTMTIVSAVTGTSNGTVTMSTTVGTSSASKSGNHTSTTTTASASPSPTDTKKNDAAGQVRAFATGGAGIVLLGAMLAGF